MTWWTLAAFLGGFALGGALGALLASILLGGVVEDEVRRRALLMRHGEDNGP